jgi:hypothetical protein
MAWHGAMSGAGGALLIYFMGDASFGLIGSLALGALGGVALACALGAFGNRLLR